MPTSPSLEYYNRIDQYSQRRLVGKENTLFLFKIITMQISLNTKTLFAAILALFVIACNSSSSNEKNPKKDNMTIDTSVAPAPPPTTPAPNVKMEPAPGKCYSNIGLKYKTVITINIGSSEVSGNVTSEELGSGKKETTAFEGTFLNDKFTIKFKGTPPVIGAASEWTDKPWTLELLEGKGQWLEKLHIIFNAKNYETNKWSDTDYEFVLVECK